jgi:hypothetical protein
MTFFNKNQESTKCVKHTSNSKDIFNNRYESCYHRINHKKNERLKVEQLCRKYGIPSKIQTGFQLRNNLPVISFRTLNSKNWQMYMSHIIPTIWEKILELNHNFSQILSIFRTYQLILNPFKYDPQKIIYIKKINNLDDSSKKYNYILFMYENYLFNMPFLNDCYQPK